MADGANAQFITSIEITTVAIVGKTSFISTAAANSSHFAVALL